MSQGLLQYFTQFIAILFCSQSGVQNEAFEVLSDIIPAKLSSIRNLGNLIQKVELLGDWIHHSLSRKVRTFSTRIMGKGFTAVW